MMRLVALILSLLLVACSSGGSHHNRPPDPTACTETQVKEVPTDEEIRAAMIAEREAILAEIAVGTLSLYAMPDWDAFPTVAFSACPFWIENAWDGKVLGGTWAAGVTNDKDHIKVSTYKGKDQTLRLVAWEYRNTVYLRGNRPDLTR